MNSLKEQQKQIGETREPFQAERGNIGKLRRIQRLQSDSGHKDRASQIRKVKARCDAKVKKAQEVKGYLENLLESFKRQTQEMTRHELTTERMAAVELPGTRKFEEVLDTINVPRHQKLQQEKQSQLSEVSYGMRAEEIRADLETRQMNSGREKKDGLQNDSTAGKRMEAVAQRESLKRECQRLKELIEFEGCL